MNAESRYPCPCCGYWTLNQPPPGTYLICPICFWEDDDRPSESSDWDIQWTGSNQVSLREAQRNFLAFGACESQWLAEVRPPTSMDYRDPHWQTLDQLAVQTRQALIPKIEAAFASVTLGKGITLHQARAIDDYQDPIAARGIDQDVPWSEIPAEWIEKFYDVFCFLDPLGMRHALPAYILWGLRFNQMDHLALAQVVYVLKTADYRDKLWPILDPTQQAVLTEFLDYMQRFEG